MMIINLMASCGFSYWPLLIAFFVPAENVNFAVVSSKTTFMLMCTIRERIKREPYDPSYKGYYLDKNSISSFTHPLNKYLNVCKSE